jgi:hypothetical protein
MNDALRPRRRRFGAGLRATSLKRQQVGQRQPHSSDGPDGQESTTAERIAKAFHGGLPESGWGMTGINERKRQPPRRSRNNI